MHIYQVVVEKPHHFSELGFTNTDTEDMSCSNVSVESFTSAESECEGFQERELQMNDSTGPMANDDNVEQLHNICAEHSRYLDDLFPKM